MPETPRPPGWIVLPEVGSNKPIAIRADEVTSLGHLNLTDGEDGTAVFYGVPDREVWVAMPFDAVVSMLDTALREVIP